MMRVLWILAAIGVAALIALPLVCGGSEPPPPWAKSGLEIRSVPRAGGLDVTFLVAADTHFGAEAVVWKGDGADRMGDFRSLLPRMVGELREIEGEAWPAEVGGRISKPRGILVAGDLTDHGRAEEWDRFAEVFGGPEGGGALPYPAYVSVGNHDEEGGTHVAMKVRQRHGGLHYSWDWEDLHLVSLGEGPDYAALAWLMEDLASTGRERPVVLFLHYPLAGPLAEWNWFGDGDYRERLAAILEGFNVVAIFHGHWHASGHYEWEGIATYNVGSWKHGYCDFLVVRITDDRIAVASRQWYGPPRWWWWQVRPLGRGRAPEIDGMDVRPGDVRRPRIPYPE